MVIVSNNNLSTGPLINFTATDTEYCYRLDFSNAELWTRAIAENDPERWGQSVSARLHYLLLVVVVFLTLLFAFVVPAIYYARDRQQASPTPTGDFQMIITTDPQNATVALDEPIRITITVQAVNGSPGKVVVGLVKPLPDDGSGPNCDQLDNTKTMAASDAWSFMCWSGNQPLNFTLNFNGTSESHRQHLAQVSLTYL